MNICVSPSSINSLLIIIFHKYSFKHNVHFELAFELEKLSRIGIWNHNSVAENQNHSYVEQVFSTCSSSIVSVVILMF